MNAEAMIFAYTRADALTDGELVDVSTTAREAGLIFPVAITRAAHALHVEWTDADTERQTYQDTAGPSVGRPVDAARERQAGRLTHRVPTAQRAA